MTYVSSWIVVVERQLVDLRRVADVGRGHREAAR